MRSKLTLFNFSRNISRGFHCTWGLTYAVMDPPSFICACTEIVHLNRVVSCVGVDIFLKCVE
jgi:hypothetical protein